MNSKILLLREKIKWMGDHSGYDRLNQSLFKFIHNPDYITINRIGGITAGILHKTLNAILGRANTNFPNYNESLSFSELRLYLKLLSNKYDLIHLNYLERSLGFMDLLKYHKHTKIIATTHQTPEWWKKIENTEQLLKNIDSLIALSVEQKSYFEKYIPGRVFLIKHGIDTGFFRPAPDSVISSRLNNPRIVFCGIWQRDLDTLTSVITKLIHEKPEIQYDLVISNHDNQKRDHRLDVIENYKQVSFHSGLSDRELLDIYQKACLLFLPINGATANNALLESISCGLPVISNDIAGIRDYTNESFAILFKRGDIEGFSSSISALLENPSRLELLSRSAAEYALNNLSWDIIAKKTVELYDSVLGK